MKNRGIVSRFLGKLSTKTFLTLLLSCGLAVNMAMAAVVTAPADTANSSDTETVTVNSGVSIPSGACGTNRCIFSNDSGFSNWDTRICGSQAGKPDPYTCLWINGNKISCSDGNSRSNTCSSSNSQSGTVNIGRNTVPNYEVIELDDDPFAPPVDSSDCMGGKFFTAGSPLGTLPVGSQLLTSNCNCGLVGGSSGGCEKSSSSPVTKNIAAATYADNGVDAPTLTTSPSTGINWDYQWHSTNTFVWNFLADRNEIKAYWIEIKDITPGLPVTTVETQCFGSGCLTPSPLQNYYNLDINALRSKSTTPILIHDHLYSYRIVAVDGDTNPNPGGNVNSTIGQFIFKDDDITPPVILSESEPEMVADSASVFPIIVSADDPANGPNSDGDPAVGNIFATHEVCPTCTPTDWFGTTLARIPASGNLTNTFYSAFLNFGSGAFTNTSAIDGDNDDSAIVTMSGGSWDSKLVDENPDRLCENCTGSEPRFASFGETSNFTVPELTTADLVAAGYSEAAGRDGDLVSTLTGVQVQMNTFLDESDVYIWPFGTITAGDNNLAIGWIKNNGAVTPLANYEDHSTKTRIYNLSGLNFGDQLKIRVDHTGSTWVPILSTITKHAKVNSIIFKYTYSWQINQTDAISFDPSNKLGVHSFTKTVVDGDNDRNGDALSYTTSEIPYTVYDDDTVGPSVSMLAPIDGQVLGAGALPFSLEADAFDASGISKVEFWANGVKVGEDTDASGGWNLAWSPADGSYELYAVAFDADNDRPDDLTPDASSSESAHINVIVDTTSPTPAELTVPPFSNNGKVYLSWTAATDANGIEKYEVYRKCENTFIIDGSCDGNFGLIATLDDSVLYHEDEGRFHGVTYTYYVKGFDVPGNFSDSNQGSVDVDTEAPGVTITEPEMNQIYAVNSINVVADFANTHNTECLAGVDLALGMEPTEDMSGDGTVSGTAAFTFTGLDEGLHYFTVACTDAAENTGEATVTDVRVDTVAPEASVVIQDKPANGFTHLVSTQLLVSCSDPEPGSGIDSCETFVSYNSGTFSSIGLAEGLQGYNFDQGDGSYTFKTVAKDLAGHETTSSTDIISVDTKDPEPSLTVTPNGFTNSNSVSLNPACVDNPNGAGAASGVSSCITEVSFQSDTPTMATSTQGSQSFSLSTGDGQYQFSTTAVDNANNDMTFGPTTETTVLLDTVPPTIETLSSCFSEDSPYSDWCMDTATITVAVNDLAGIIHSGVASVMCSVNAATPFECSGSFDLASNGGVLGENTITVTATDVATNVANTTLSVKIDKDSDSDGVYDNFDTCDALFGDPAYQGCPFGVRGNVVLHIIDQIKSNICPNGAGSCRLPLANVTLRVFDRNDSSFQTAWTSNPSGTLYDQVFENGVGQIGTCITDTNGYCVAGVPALGEFIVIAKYTEAGKTVYTGLPGGPGEVVETLAIKNLQIIKTLMKDGSIDWKGGSKTVVPGSILEIVYPQATVWDGNKNIYPFTFTTYADEGEPASEWNVDVCASIPTGYQITAVLDENGNTLLTNDCIQALVADTPKVLLFTIIDVASPEPNMSFKMNLKHKGKDQSVTAEIPGRKISKKAKKLALAPVAPVVSTAVESQGMANLFGVLAEQAPVIGGGAAAALLALGSVRYLRRKKPGKK